MKLLNKILGINTSSVQEIKEQLKQNEVSEQEQKPENAILAHLTLLLGVDGAVHIKTEWANESEQLSSVYAQLLYQINAGALEDGMMEVLLKFGAEHVQSQEFISKVFEQYQGFKDKYKSLPIITPTQALAVSKEK